MDSQALKSRKALREKERARLSVCDETLICLREREREFFFYFFFLMYFCGRSGFTEREGYERVGSVGGKLKCTRGRRIMI